MRSIQRIKKLFWFAIGCQFLMSASILLMPFAVQIGQKDRKITVLIGLAFWFSAIAGYVLLIMANAERKWLIVRKFDGNVKMDCRPGIAELFSNVPATIADVTMLLSFFLFVIINFTDWKMEYISYVLLFILLFSLHMHCMFNGRIYKVTKYKCTRRDSSYE